MANRQRVRYWDEIPENNWHHSPSSSPDSYFTADNLGSPSSIKSSKSSGSDTTNDEIDR